MSFAATVALEKRTKTPEERIMQNARTMCMAVLLLIVGFVGAENLLFSDCGVRTSRRQPRSYFTGAPNNGNGSASTPSQSFMRSPKIMHGTPTVEGQYPWQVSLELLHPSYGFIGHWCGGVLIDRNWVLSAAHCIHNDLFNLPLPALWTVVLGEYDRRTESGFEQRIPVDKIILHEKYHNFKHDLVLLKLTRPASTAPNSRVRKICLPFADFKVNSMAFDPRPDQQSRPEPSDKPAYFFDQDQEYHVTDAPPNQSFPDDPQAFPDSIPFRDDNFLRRLRKEFESDTTSARGSRTRTARYMVNHLVVGQVMSLRTNRTKLPSPGAAKSSNRASRRFFTVGMLDTKSHPRKENNDGLRWNYRTAVQGSGRIDSSGHVANHRQHHRANLNSKFGNNRRRNDKFSHAPVYYRNEPNYRTEGTNDRQSIDGGDSIGGFETDSAASAGAMPDTSQYVDCLATGWGKSTIDDELTDVLLQTRAPIQSSKKCEEAYGDFIKLHRGHLCAGNLDGAGGTCVGDSGGPLQCRISKRGPWILVGITSFGSGCAFKNYPDVYTKISFYRQWIVETIQNN